MFEKLLGKFVLSFLAVFGVCGVFMMLTMPGTIELGNELIRRHVATEVTLPRVIVIGLALVGLKIGSRAFERKSQKEVGQ